MAKGRNQDIWHADFSTKTPTRELQIREEVDELVTDKL